VDDTSSTWEFDIFRIQDCVNMASVDRHGGILCEFAAEVCVGIWEYTVEENCEQNCEENNVYAYNKIIKNEMKIHGNIRISSPLGVMPNSTGTSP